MNRFVSPDSRDLAGRQSKTRPDDSGRGKAGASRHVGVSVDFRPRLGFYGSYCERDVPHLTRW